MFYQAQSVLQFILWCSFIFNVQVVKCLELEPEGTVEHKITEESKVRKLIMFKHKKGKMQVWEKIKLFPTKKFINTK